METGPDSLAPGAKMAVQDGFFTIRLLLPEGYRVAPHWHPKIERLTIISGVVNLGAGDTFDMAATKALPAGTYSAMPPKMTHYTWMTGRERGAAQQHRSLGSRVRQSRRRSSEHASMT